MIPVSFTAAALAVTVVIGAAFLVALAVWIGFILLLPGLWHSASLDKEREERVGDDPPVRVDHPMWFPKATRRSRGDYQPPEDF